MKADIVTKDFMSDADVFADVFNYCIYGGQQMIHPGQLTEQDSVEIALPYGTDGKAVPVQRFRDVQKLYASKTDGKARYVLYGIENQSEIHYAMAVKNNLYDALDYAGQVEAAAKAHRRERKEAREQGRTLEQTPNSGEFLGGFWKEDRLIPSITVTVYFGGEKWDGPLSLFDMMDAADDRLFSCMDNYHVRLVAPALMTDDEIGKFQSNLREVLLFIKYSKDKDKIDEILKTNGARFREIERRAVDVIEVITNMGLHYEKGERKVDMCQAIQDMRRESEQIGEERGRKIGEERGRQIGELLAVQKSARNFYRMGLKVEEVAEGLGYDVDTVKEWLNL